MKPHVRYVTDAPTLLFTQHCQRAGVPNRLSDVKYSLPGLCLRVSDFAFWPWADENENENENENERWGSTRTSRQMSPNPAVTSRTYRLIKVIFDLE